MASLFHRYHFSGQREGEEVVRVIHRHWFNIFAHFLLILLFSLLLVGSLVTLPALFPDMLRAVDARFFIFMENTFFIFLWLFSFLIWIDYYFDVWIITSQRIVNIEQKGLFNRHISELNFSNIQDVTTTVEGIIPTVLNFGEVLVQTAGEKERFVFHMVPDPYKIKDAIMKISEHSRSDGLR
ncbi:MAG: PH domain-containing protein [Candidatus Moraniibacteriota bacterium]